MNTKNVILWLIVLISRISFAQEKNSAFGKPVVATSEATGYPATNMVDGKISRTLRWEAATERRRILLKLV